MTTPGPTPRPSPHRTPPVLEEIVAHKRAEVEAAKARTPEAALRELAGARPMPRNFFAAVTRSRAGQTAVIAEVKRRSPSAGLIRPEYAGPGFRPEDIATRYHAAGAAAISCLTDEKFFGGELGYIERIKAAVPLPVLRKDFIIDPWQVWESRAAGADAVLLIVECLPEAMLVDLLILAHGLGLTTLLEAHGPEQVEVAVRHAGFPHPAYGLIGINNRDLSSMRVDLGQTLRLAEKVEARHTLVSESGIKTPGDLRRLRGVGVRIALVGEHLMREADPGVALLGLLGPGAAGGQQ